jgi:hypothetical protein
MIILIRFSFFAGDYSTLSTGNPFIVESKPTNTFCFVDTMEVKISNQLYTRTVSQGDVFPRPIEIKVRSLFTSYI